MENPQTTELPHAACRPPLDRAPPSRHEFANLVKSIALHGQRVPAIVRPIEQSGSHRYEIVCGVRRHHAIGWLKHFVDRIDRPFLVTILPLSDQEAFLTADIDNRHRKDISDLQRAQEFAGALQNWFRGDQRDMAARLGISPTALSLYLSLASLPGRIHRAFGDPTRITISHTGKLAPMLKIPAQEAALLQAAEKLAANQRARLNAERAYIAPAGVMQTLLATAPALPSHTVTDKAGCAFATGRIRRDHGTEIRFHESASTRLEEAHDACLEILLALHANSELSRAA